MDPTMDHSETTTNTLKCLLFLVRLQFRYIFYILCKNDVVTLLWYQGNNHGVFKM